MIYSFMYGDIFEAMVLASTLCAGADEYWSIRLVALAPVPLFAMALALLIVAD